MWNFNIPNFKFQDFKIVSYAKFHLKIRKNVESIIE